MSKRVREDLIRFVDQLKRDNDRMTWQEVAERCRERFPEAEGLSLTANAIRKRYHARVREAESSPPSVGNKESEMMNAEDREQILQELKDWMEDHIETCALKLIERFSAQAAERVFEEKFANLQNVPIVERSANEGYPPAPPLPQNVEGTRRHAVTRRKLSGTVDAILLELFEKERKERGCSVSRMLDVVLWNYFGIGRNENPKLSFELSEPSDGSP